MALFLGLKERPDAPRAYQIDPTLLPGARALRVVGWRGRGDSAPWKICLFHLLPSYVTAKTKMHTRSSNNNNGIAAGRFACCLSFSINACVVSRAFQWPGVGPNAWPRRAIIDGPCRNPLPSTPPAAVPAAKIPQSEASK